MLTHGLQCILSTMALLLIVAAGTVEGTAFQVYLANIEEKLFFRYVETQGAPLRAARHVLPRLLDILDQAQLSEHTLVPDRQVRLVSLNKRTAPTLSPPVPTVVPPQSHNPWMIIRWEGESEDTAVLHISSFQANYQELVAVAVQTNGVLRRLPVYGVPLFGRKKLLAPALSTTYITYLLERGRFGTWVSKHAESLDGLSVVVGRSHDLHFPDSVYVVVRVPPTTKTYTYKVVLAWKDREETGKITEGPSQ